MKRKKITIEVTDEEVDALEDIFFTKLSEEAMGRLSDAKHSLWKKIATAFDSEEEPPMEMLAAEGEAEAQAKYEAELQQEEDEHMEHEQGHGI